MPLFNIETPQSRGVLVAVGWSGNWTADFRVDGRQLRARAGLTASRFYLRPGETVRTPRILVLFWEGRRLHGHNMFRRLLYRHYVPRLGDKPQQPLVSINSCFTYRGRGLLLDDMNGQAAMALLPAADRLGVELFVIDAGWYTGKPWLKRFGHWTPSRQQYPNGFRPISQSLAKANIQFGLWFAPEMLSNNSPVVRDHPEWVRPSARFSDAVLRLELPGAREWFLARLDELVKHHGLTCYRQDLYAFLPEDSCNRQGVTESRHIAGLYRLWRETARRHPDLVMEGCAGGGRRLDLETISRFHWHQKSDHWFHPESDQASLYGANLCIPGGLINVPTDRVDDYGVWSSFAGQLSLAWSPLDEGFLMQQGQLQVQRYTRIRHLLCGDFYPLTPCTLDGAWIGYQFHRTDLDAGFVLLFRRYDSPEALYPVRDRLVARLRGVDPDRTYHVRYESDGTTQTMTGRALSAGVPVARRTAPAAELIAYKGESED